MSTENRNIFAELRAFQVEALNGWGRSNYVWILLSATKNKLNTENYSQSSDVITTLLICKENLIYSYLHVYMHLIYLEPGLSFISMFWVSPQNVVPGTASH